MPKEYKLSLLEAILININTMMGAGIFINTVELAKRAGAVGSFMYLIIGLLMAPLIISIAKLVSLYPEGGFYIFAQKEISSFAGFVSSWSYFIGKLASATLMIHAAMLLAQQVVPFLATYNILFLDFLIVNFFIMLNMLDIKKGSIIQACFMALKITPIIFVILSGLFLIKGTNVSAAHIKWSGLPLTLPLVIYVFSGFEVVCLLSSKIRDPQRNGPRAIFFSYGFVILFYFLYQFIFYGNLGTLLAQQSNYLSAFPLLTHLLFPQNIMLSTMLHGFFHLAIVASALGGSYGIIYSNNWNLYTLAQYKHTFFPHLLTKLNRYLIPFASLIVEGLLCLLYVLIIRGSQIPLQQIASLSYVITYGISVLALLVAKIKRPELVISRWIPFLGIANSLIFFGFCLHNFIVSGLYPLYIFMILLMGGIGMFVYTKKDSQGSNEVLR